MIIETSSYQPNIIKTNGLYSIIYMFTLLYELSTPLSGGEHTKYH